MIPCRLPDDDFEAMDESMNVVYQAYGLDGIRTQALYAAYSALAHRGAADVRVHLYADRPEFFAPLAEAISIHPLSPERIQAWRGPENFTHRLKIAMILDLIGCEHPDEKFLYLDADTFFTRDYDTLWPKIDLENGVMHVREYPVWSKPSGQIRRFRKHMAPLRFQGQPVDLQGWMWNAGAIGLDPSRFGLMQTVIEYIDELYPKYPKGLVEQYGVSYFLQTNVALQPCDDYVFHYWAQKDEYEAAIGERLALYRTLSVEEACAHLREHPIALPPPAPKKKWYQKLVGA